MATVNYAAQSLAGLNADGRLVLWETITVANADGQALNCSFAKTGIMIQAFGTWDSNTITVQGSLDGTNWFTLKTTGGSDATLTANGGLSIVSLPLYIRPLNSSGTTIDIDVYCFAK